MKAGRMMTTDLDCSVSACTTVVASSNQVSSDLGGETIILNVKTGQYFGVDAVGTQIWNLLKEPQSLMELKDAILNTYDVEPDRCERDLRNLLRELANEGLIEVCDETNA